MHELQKGIRLKRLMITPNWARAAQMGTDVSQCANSQAQHELRPAELPDQAAQPDAGDLALGSTSDCFRRMTAPRPGMNSGALAFTP